MDEVFFCLAYVDIKDALKVLSGDGDLVVVLVYFTPVLWTLWSQIPPFDVCEVSAGRPRMPLHLANPFTVSHKHSVTTPEGKYLFHLTNNSDPISLPCRCLFHHRCTLRFSGGGDALLWVYRRAQYLQGVIPSKLPLLFHCLVDFMTIRKHILSSDVCMKFCLRI